MALKKHSSDHEKQMASDPKVIIAEAIEAALDALRGAKFATVDVTALANRQIKRRWQNIKSSILDRQVALHIAERRRKAANASKNLAQQLASW